MLITAHKLRLFKQFLYFSCFSADCFDTCPGFRAHGACSGSAGFRLLIAYFIFTKESLGFGFICQFARFLLCTASFFHFAIRFAIDPGPCFLPVLIITCSRGNAVGIIVGVLSPPFSRSLSSFTFHSVLIKIQFKRPVLHIHFIIPFPGSPHRQENKRFPSHSFCPWSSFPWRSTLLVVVVSPNRIFLFIDVFSIGHFFACRVEHMVEWRFYHPV